LQQRQGIERTGRMVGDDQQAALRRNAALAFGLDRRAQVEVVDGRVDEGQPLQVTVVGEEGIGLVELRPAPQRAQQRLGQPGTTATEPVGIAFGDLAFQRVHGRGRRRGFAAQPARVRRQPGCRFLAIR